MSDNTQNSPLEDRAVTGSVDHIDDALREEAARQLHEEVAKFEKQLEELETVLAGMFSDHDTIQEDRDSTRQAIESTRGDLQRAQRALDRIDDGTFGLCTSCGGPIAAPRLEAIPEAERCTNCA